MDKFSQKKIIKDLKKGHFTITFHANQRMNEREIYFEDIIKVAETAFKIWYQKEKSTWSITGLDLDHNELTVIAGLEDNDTIVITVIYYH